MSTTEEINNTTETNETNEIQENTNEESSTQLSPSRKTSTPIQRTRKGSSRARSASSSISPQLNTEERQQGIHSLTDQMFVDVAQLAQGEMQIGLNDLKLLEQMNHYVTKKYDGMHQRTTSVKEHVTKMKEQFEKFKPYFEQIDEIDKQLDELNNITKVLDGYTANLEKQLRPYLL